MADGASRGTLRTDADDRRVGLLYLLRATPKLVQLLTMGSLQAALFQLIPWTF